jgi:hypothetical protein
MTHLTPLSVRRVPFRVDRKAINMERARELRKRTDSVFELEQSVQNSEANVDRRSADLDVREHRIRRAEAALAEKERAVAEQPPALEQPRPVKRHGGAKQLRLSQSDSDPATMAAEIIRSGKIRRRELAAPLPIPQPRNEAERLALEKAAPMARAIIAAAAKARGTAPQTQPELPSNPKAKAIILASRRQRGTIDAADERWLADYFGKLEATRLLMGQNT